MDKRWSDQQLAAAVVADKYIEILLSTKPEMLISHISHSNDRGTLESAKQLTVFRQQLISGLSSQPLPNFVDD